jgi:hypothetical protein
LQLFLDVNEDRVPVTARTQTRPRRPGTKVLVMLASVSARAWSAAVRAAGRVRRTACTVAVKEIRSGSRPRLAAARQMTARMAW